MDEKATSIPGTLEPYHANVSKRLVKTFKVYFRKTGMCAWSTGWTSPETQAAQSLPLTENHASIPVSAF